MKKIVDFLDKKSLAWLCVFWCVIAPPALANPANADKLQHITLQEMNQKAPDIVGGFIKFVIYLAVATGVAYIFIFAVQLKKPENVGSALFLCLIAGFLLLGFAEVVARLAGMSLLYG